VYHNHHPKLSVRLWGCTTLKIGKPSNVRLLVSDVINSN